MSINQFVKGNALGHGGACLRRAVFGRPLTRPDRDKPGRGSVTCVPFFAGCQTSLRRDKPGGGKLVQRQSWRVELVWTRLVTAADKLEFKLCRERGAQVGVGQVVAARDGGVSHQKGSYLRASFLTGSVFCALLWWT